MLDVRKAYAKGSGTLTDPVAGNVIHGLRRRCTAAEINAGVTLVAAKRGWKLRLHDLNILAVGGAAAGATDVRVLGTQSGSSAALAVVAVAGLTQSTLNRLGSAAVVILADGASMVPNDHNTAITAGKTGGSLTGATAIDIEILYEAVKA